MDVDESQLPWIRDTCDCIMECIMADTANTTCDCYRDDPLLKFELGTNDLAFVDSQWSEMENSGVYSPPLQFFPPPLSIPIPDSPLQHNKGKSPISQVVVASSVLTPDDALYNIVVPDSPDSRVNSPSSWARPRLNLTGYRKTVVRSLVESKIPKKLTMKEQLQILKDVSSSDVILNLIL